LLIAAIVGMASACHGNSNGVGNGHNEDFVSPGKGAPGQDEGWIPPGQNPEFVPPGQGIDWLPDV